MVYMFLWFLGDAYVIRSGALQWEETETRFADEPAREEDELPVAV
jgi:hypothetical protein